MDILQVRTRRSRKKHIGTSLDGYFERRRKRKWTLRNDAYEQKAREQVAREADEKTKAGGGAPCNAYQERTWKKYIGTRLYGQQ